MNRFQFVADHQTTYQVKRLCQVLELSRSSFYAWQKAAPARQQRAEADAQLAARIRHVQDPKAGGDPAYGAPRVTVELNDAAEPDQRVNHKRVARVMRAHQLAGIRLRRRVRTTVPEPADEKYPDLLRQYFPKGTDLSRWTAADLEAVAHTLNNRPRKSLGWRTPAEVFDEQLRSLHQAGVARTD